MKVDLGSVQGPAGPVGPIGERGPAGLNAIISKVINEKNGYIMLNEGLCIAWGSEFYQDLKPNEWNDKEVIYPRQFRECLSCLVSSNAHSLGVNRIEVNKISDDKFNPHHVQISVKSPTAWGGVSWIAIGTV